MIVFDVVCLSIQTKRLGTYLLTHSDACFHCCVDNTSNTETHTAEGRLAAKKDDDTAHSHDCRTRSNAAGYNRTAILAA